MAFEKKFFGNGGALFTVKQKKSDRGPDLTGSVDLGEDTVKYIVEQFENGNTDITLDLSVWKKVARTGTKFLSLKVREPFKKTDAPARPAKAASFDDDDGDEIPF